MVIGSKQNLRLSVFNDVESTVALNDDIGSLHNPKIDTGVDPNMSLHNDTGVDPSISLHNDTGVDSNISLHKNTGVDSNTALHNDTRVDSKMSHHNITGSKHNIRLSIRNDGENTALNNDIGSTTRTNKEI